MTDDPLDCLVIGAGPAGLTAAIYLARFHLAIRIVDDGSSRAALIPKTRNHAGYPGGIAGTALLGLMREQAAEYAPQVIDARIDTIAQENDLFVARTALATFRARSVLLATGVVNNRPPIDDAVHARALSDGRLRYCPICDGYEVTDKAVGIIGTRSHGFNEAVFLRMYSRDVTLIAPDQEHALSPAEQARLDELGIATVAGPCEPLRLAGERILVSTPHGEMAFDSVYPALGSVIRSELAVSLGADASKDGCLVVDEHQRTSVTGLYAAGDVTRGLDQISHAMGQAGVAATTIRNDLAERHVFAR